MSNTTRRTGRLVLSGDLDGIKAEQVINKAVKSLDIRQEHNLTADPFPPEGLQPCDIDESKLGRPDRIIDNVKVWLVPEEEMRTLFPNL